MAAEIFPLVIPSINLAKNNITNARVITKVPRRDELTLNMFLRQKQCYKKKYPAD
ncbi:MAG TPA: hypothetical protein VE593_02775 [Nitrososphaeraceae archaeon]|nr:hypothetical protein [Nitrososphaeraceae archaeon]